MIRKVFRPLNDDGWRLEVQSNRDPRHHNPALRPLLMIPGYGMNAFILGYHPTGDSMIEHLVGLGFEVWTANLRGQGGSYRLSGPKEYGFAQLALHDLPVAINQVLAESSSDQRQVDLIGCSLGGTLMYTFLAHHPGDPRVGSLVSVGGPLRWDTVHPLVKVAFSSRRLIGAIPMRGTRTLATWLLPALKRVPSLLSIYMNASIVDMSASHQMVRTVENPCRQLNREIAGWIKATDLSVRGVNVSHGLRHATNPVYCILANRDGIVTPAAALSVRDAMPNTTVDVLNVGTPDVWFAHADLFVSNHAQEEVFGPLGAWLSQQNVVQ